MTLAAAPLLGLQEPRVSFAPASVVSTAKADEAVELCSAAGLVLDPWQDLTLHMMLGETVAGLWAAFEFALLVSRQNGKGGALEGRELAGLFLFGERNIIHSAHEAETARDAFLRMEAIIDGNAFLTKRLRRIIRAPGREQFQLMDGRRLRYRTRTSGGGRGFSGSPVILDEAQELVARQFAAILPVVAAQPNPQIIYAGTVKPGAAVFRGAVERVRQRVGDAIGGVEFSAEPDAVSDDVEAQRAANPALGYRLTEAYIRNELAAFRAAMAEDEWRMERLSIWPEAAEVGQLIAVPAWVACQTSWRPAEGQLLDHVGVATSVDGAWSSVGVAFRHDGKTFVHVSKHAPGSDWVVPYVAGLAERRRPRTVVVDGGGPASKSLANAFRAVLPEQVFVETSTKEMQAAVAQFVDAVDQGRLEHVGQAELDAAATGVKEKLVGDARMYDRRKSKVVVAPVEAVTLAAWGLLRTVGRPSKYETGNLLVL